MARHGSQFRELLDHIAALEDAIREHRDQKADDRCWEDDLKLYGVLPEGVADADLRLPPKEEFLGRCALYEAHRRCGTSKPWRSVVSLEAQLAAQAQPSEQVVGALRVFADKRNWIEQPGAHDGFDWMWDGFDDPIDVATNALAALKPPGDASDQRQSD